MVRVIREGDREFYRCEECGFQYADDSTSLITGKEWAEKCEAWCKEHKSCNLKITAHAIPEESDSGGDTPWSARDRVFLTRLFYGLIGTAASLAFFLALYWALRLDSAITNVITNTYGTPFYFWPYVVLTFGTVVLFGVNASLLTYRWRKFGPPRLKGQAGTGAGTLVGVAASACPVCGSTILAAIGIAGGLAAFPLQGLELKVLSFGFMALPIWLIRRDLKKLECGDGTCPVPKDHRFKESDRPWLILLLVATAVMAWIGWNMLKTEPIIAKMLSRSEIVNPGVNTLYSVNGTAAA